MSQPEVTKVSALANEFEKEVAEIDPQARYIIRMKQAVCERTMDELRKAFANVGSFPGQFIVVGADFELFEIKK